MGLVPSYLICINLVTFALYAIDKIKARAGAWRISEFVLILLAVIGGSVGALAAMTVCRHKIRVPKFKIGVPLILIVQIVIVYFIGTGEF